MTTSSFPTARLRRLRQTASLRSMVRETVLSTTNLMMPLFVVPGTGVKKEISSMQGQYHFSIDTLTEECKKIRDLGIPSILLFGVPEHKDPQGSSAWNDKGIIQRAVTTLKEHVPGLTVTTDLCFCEYTDHGHCGIMKDDYLQNDPTLEIIVKQTLSHARAGADIIAPSGMLDGTVKAMRQGLDDAGFENTVIMGYSAKFASGFYGPFRVAVDSAPQSGDRKSYQMDPANGREALREIELDIAEGADIVMVKPALAYLDIIYAAKQRFGVPMAAYHVSGEYAMIKAAAAKGWIDGTRVMLESLQSIRRAGADIILTYFAEEVAQMAKGGLIRIE